MKTRPDLAALALCGLVIVCVTLCAVLRVDVPELLPQLGLIVAGIGGGAALPRGTSTADTIVADAPAPVVIPEPRAVLEQPVATHAP